MSEERRPMIGGRRRRNERRRSAIEQLSAPMNKIFVTIVVLLVCGVAFFLCNCTTALNNSISMPVPKTEMASEHGPETSGSPSGTEERPTHP
jgi:hypothetical protein